MKLYYAPAVCSMAAHIVANEAGLALDLKKVDLRAKPHRIEDGRALKDVNEKASFPYWSSMTAACSQRGWRSCTTLPP